MRTSQISVVLLVVHLQFSGGAQAEQDSIEQLQIEVSQWVQAGNLVAALPVAERLLAAVEQMQGPDHLDTAQAASDLAWLRFSAGDYAGAVADFSQALAIQEPALGDNHLLTASTLAALAMSRQWAGQLELAEPLYLRAKAGFIDSRNPSHPDLAAVLKNLADLFWQTGRAAEAEPYYREAITIWSSHYGAGYEIVESTWIALAGLRSSLGDQAGELTIYQDLLAARRTRFGLADPRSLEMAAAVVSVQVATGQFAAALPLAEEAAAVAGDNPSGATLLDGLARLHAGLGDTERAVQLTEKALEIVLATAADQLLRVEAIRTNLATLYRDRGDYARAEPLYRETLARLSGQSLDGIEFFATVSHELGTLHAEIGDYAQAEELFERTIRIYAATLGDQHLFVATALGSLAALYLSTERLTQSGQLFEQSLQIYRTNYGEDSIFTARAKGNLAALYQAQKQHQAAAPLIEQTIDTLRAVLGEDHPDTSYYVNNLGVLKMASGNYTEARKTFEQALKRLQISLGASHPATATIRQNLAYLLGITGHSQESLEMFQQTLRENDEILHNVFAIASERQKLAYVRKSAWAYERLLSLIQDRFTDDPEAVRSGMNWVLARKAIVFDAQSRQRESIAAALDGNAREQWSRLSELRATLATTLISSGAGKTAVELATRVRELREQIETLESHLAASSALVASDIQSRATTSRDLQSRLPKDSVLVEFVRFRDVDWKAGQWADSHRYVAFVMAAGGEIQWVDLGDADDLEARAAALGRALQSNPATTPGRRSQEQASRRLYQMIWAPLAAAVGKAERIWLSPDGILNQVSFASLKNEQGRFLIEDHALAYLTAGRDLAKLLDYPANSDLLLVANPAFGHSPTPQEPLVSRSGAGPQPALQSFVALPGTTVEARGIPALVGGERQRILMGEEATEAAILAAGTPRVMHLATHGFFLGEVSVSSDQNEALRAAGIEPRFAISGNPLARSGLALAGANRTVLSPDHSDGVLTALEVSALNLRGTDLVTLSACDTGRGEIHTGEGVFGLRRAFSLAGTRHLMMSLWSVADEATAEQMLMFYQRYGDGEEPAVALRAAQIGAITKYRNQFGSAPASLWAGFIVQGSGGRQATSHHLFQ